MHRLPSGRRSLVLQLLDRPDHPHSLRLPIQIPGFEALVGLHGREDGASSPCWSTRSLAER